MKKDKVPQDDGNVFEGKIKPLKYAVDDAGNYTRVSSAGWEPEQIVLSQAWVDIHEKAELIREKVLEGKLSPLAYHMECKMLNPEMLGGYVGYSAFRVRLHLKPWFFRRLTHHQIEKYARALQIRVDEVGRV